VPPPAPKVAEPRPPTPTQAVDIRRDYELAERIGTIEAWDLFLATHRSGFYADLAKVARAKVAAEQAKAAEQQRTAEAAKSAAQTQARATEQARAKTEEDAKAKAAEEARLKAEQAKVAPPTVVAAAPSQPATADPRRSTDAPAIDPSDVARLLQAHLKRVGCDPGNMDGNWNDSSRRALDQFNKRAGTKLDIQVASLNALDAVKGKTSRVCPLVCGKGYRADRDTCVAITCKAGFVLDGDECVKKEAPKSAAKPAPTSRSAEPAARESKPAESSSGQVFCNRSGCQTVPKNCTIEFAHAQQGSAGGQMLRCR
jgi:hypothetical protein